MTTAAYTVSDEEIAQLVADFGTDQLVAMVHTLAWANFRNRILLALGTQLEADGPLAPFDPHLDPDQRNKLATPKRPEWKDAIAPESILTKPDWRRQTADDLAKSLELQKARKPRIALPDESKLDKLPPETKARAAENRMVARQYGLPTAADANLVRDDGDLSARSTPRSIVQQLDVLGDYAQQRMLLLNGPQ